jgi:ketosteroid isomerase-like protein
MNLCCIAVAGSVLLPPLTEANDPISDPKRDIQAVLDKQVGAWNRGDVEGFMAGYWHSPDLIYLANNKVVRGWQSLLDFYHQTFNAPGGKEMGVLELTEVEIVMLGKDAALVWGRYRVTTRDAKTRGGLYTLIMRKLPQGWLTVHDRTSSEAQ